MIIYFAINWILHGFKSHVQLNLILYDPHGHIANLILGDLNYLMLLLQSANN